LSLINEQQKKKKKGADQWEGKRTIPGKGGWGPPRSNPRAEPTAAPKSKCGGEHEVLTRGKLPVLHKKKKEKEINNKKKRETA